MRSRVKKPGTIKIYKSDRASKIIDTIYGETTYYDLLLKRQKEMKQHGRKAEIKRLGPHVSLVVNKIAGRNKPLIKKEDI